MTYSDQKIYEINEKDPLDALMRTVRASGGRKKGLIVFDNFETILSNESLIKELGNMLILLDDDDYAPN
jgi:hypothetical protein